MILIFSLFELFPVLFVLVILEAWLIVCLELRFLILNPKTSHKLCKTIRQGKKVSQVVGAGKSSNGLLYSETKKCENSRTIKMQK